MAKSKDLFDDTTMTFGEHLEVLRIHLWKAIIGLVLCVLVTLIFGNRIVDVVRAPIDAALQEMGQAPAEDDVSGFTWSGWFKSWYSDNSGEVDAGVTDAGLEHLEPLAKLKRVDLRGTKVTAVGLRRFKAQFPKVEVAFDPLELVGLGDWRALGARCELDEQYELVALTFRSAEATDEHLERLRSHVHLQRLDLNGSGITDRGLESLAPLVQLRTLLLRGTKITDSGLETIEQFGNLEELDLRRTAVTDDGLETLSSWKQLKSLAVSGADVTDDGLTGVAKLTNLEALDLRGTAITDSGLEQLQPLRRLKTLKLSGPQITDGALTHLEEFNELENLTLAATSISSAGLEHLAALTNLQELSFFHESSGDAMSEQQRIDAADMRTITVAVQPSDVAALLHRSDPETYPEPARSSEERPWKLALAAPEFREFRETAVNLKKPITLNVQEAFLMFLKVAFVAGLVLASPWVFYQLWLFVAAGLYPHERRYVHLYLPVSIGLFVGGAMFCFFVVFPFVLKFLLSFNAWLGVTPQIRLSEWITFAIMLPVMFGLSFQLPLVMLFLERISIFEVKDYREKRRLAILAISIISMLMTPADPMSMILMMMPLLALYELGIWMCGFSPAPRSPFAEEAP